MILAALSLALRRRCQYHTRKEVGEAVTAIAIIISFTSQLTMMTAASILLYMGPEEEPCSFGGALHLAYLLWSASGWAGFMLCWQLRVGVPENVRTCPRSIYW